MKIKQEDHAEYPESGTWRHSYHMSKLIRWQTVRDIINMQFDHNIVYPTYSKTVKYGSAPCTMQQGFPIN